MMWLWTLAVLMAALFCIARAVVDLRARKYGWGLLGLVSAAIFLLVPIQTHAVKYDLPPPSTR